MKEDEAPEGTPLKGPDSDPEILALGIFRWVDPLLRQIRGARKRFRS